MMENPGSKSCNTGMQRGNWTGMAQLTYPSSSPKTLRQDQSGETDSYQQDCNWLVFPSPLYQELGVYRAEDGLMHSVKQTQPCFEASKGTPTVSKIGGELTQHILSAFLTLSSELAISAQLFPTELSIGRLESMCWYTENSEICLGLLPLQHSWYACKPRFHRIKARVHKMPSAGNAVDLEKASVKRDKGTATWPILTRQSGSTVAINIAIR